jgi:uncharacterized membrane protein YeaQ/YmgE (transglycosylase-associated protein family)
VGLVAWIVVGLVAGALARAVTGYNDRTPPSARLGCLGTIAVGVLGGLVGGALTSAATGDGIGDFGLRSIVVAFLGAVLLLLVVQALSGRRR